MVKLNGLQSADFIRCFTELIEKLNATAMQLVQQRNFESALEILGWCEHMTADRRCGEFPVLRNLTFNNLGCYFRRLGDLPQALSYLNHAITDLEATSSMQESAKTYLNLCAVYSQLGKYHVKHAFVSLTCVSHNKAEDYAKNALIRAQDELLTHQQGEATPTLMDEKVKISI